MSAQKIDQKAINKLRNLYNTKLKELKLENEKLKFKLDDKKQTLELNQELLIDALQNFSTTKGENIDEEEEDEKISENNNNDSNSIKKMIERSKILHKKISTLIEEKTEKEKSIYLLQKEIPMIQEKIIEKINILYSQSEQKTKENHNLDTTIKKLKQDLDKIRRNAFFKKARTEILVAPPSKSSVEINLELINTQQILSKASKLHQEKKKKSEEIWRKEKNLKEEMNRLKTSIINEKEINKEEQNDFLEEIGYNLIPEKYEREEEEESEDSEQSSDDDKNNRGGGDKKKKEKELKNLKDETSKLQKKIEEFESKITEYKKISRNYKTDIEKIKLKSKK